MNLRTLRFIGPRQPFLQAICRDKTVLHLGCTGSPDVDGRIARGESTHMNLLKTARAVYGVDLDAQAVQRMRDVHGVQHLHVGNAEHLDQLEMEEIQQFDIVLAAELIEHLSCPGKLLDGVKRFLRPDSRLLLTTPNPLSVKYFLHALRGNEVQGPDHTLMISPQSGTLLFEARHGFKVRQIYTCLETHAKLANRVTKPFFSAAFKLAPWYADGLIFELGV